MNDAAKAELIASFSAFLDRSEPGAPDDADLIETSPDLFTLLAELATLKNEVKLEARQVKTALDEFRSLFDQLRDSAARLEEERKRRQAAEHAAERQAHRDLLLELLELRDRLEAGSDQAARFRPGWLGRRAAATFVSSMGEGIAMSLRRLEENLARQGIRPLQVERRPFDPHTMHAAEIAEDPRLPEGQVVAELRKGFMHHDKLLRPAEVRVNRIARTPPQRDKPRLNH